VRQRLALTAVLALSLAAVVIPAASTATPTTTDSTALRNGVTVAGIRAHEVPYDSCYHQLCDSYPPNLNDTALDQLGDGTAHAVLQFAMATAP
jgi:hypothetical protein